MLENLQKFWKSPFFGPISEIYTQKWPSMAQTKNDTKKMYKKMSTNFCRTPPFTLYVRVILLYGSHGGMKCGKAPKMSHSRRVEKL